MKKYITYYFLFAIIIIAAFLRLYKLGSIAPGISWDEASVGYNAYTILRWGKDEWGRVLPTTFKSFEDFKNPIHVYLTVPSIGIFGLNEFATRFPAALMGVGNVLLIYLLSSKLFKNKYLGLLSAFVLAISPYNIQFSRFNHELNFAIFFFTLGCWLFLSSLEGKKKYIVLAYIFLGLDLLTYQSAKIVTPPLVFLLTLINIRTLLKFKSHFIYGFLIYIFFIVLLFIKPELLGTARLKQNAISDSETTNTYLYKKTANKYLGMFEVVGVRYKEYFGYKFLFESGDPIPRHSAQIVGTFYKSDSIFLILGLIYLQYLILLKKDKSALFLAAWGLVALVPAAASSIFTHAARSMFITVSWHIVLSLGVYKTASLLKFKVGRVFVIGIFLTFSLLGLYKYLKYYYGEFSVRYAIEWQYGMRDIVSFITNNPKYYSIYMTDAHSQPYIFFLYYLKTPLPEFLKTVKYNNTISRPSNLVTSFGRFHFGMWDQIESYPAPEILYILNPSKYDGLRYRDQFNVMKKIEYPNKVDAFFIVNGLK